MVFCKLCSEATTGSSADKKMCKKCYNSITKYKRLKSKVCTSDEKDFIKHMDAIFTESMEFGGYVPACFLTVPSKRMCATCGKEFSTSTKSTTCHDCYSRLTLYNSLHKYNPLSPALQDHDIHYRQLKKLGFRVPKLYDERERLML